MKLSKRSYRDQYLRRFIADTPTGGSDQPQPPQPEHGEPTLTLEEALAERDKWKHFARQNEDRAKANAEKAKRLDEIEEQSKSELQKALEAQQAAEKRAQDAETAALRSRIAAKHSIPEALLSGGDEESLEASAAALLAWRGEPAATVKSSTPGAGTAGAQGADIAGVQQLTQEQLKGMSPAEINKARQEGRLDNILGIKR